MYINLEFDAECLTLFYTKFGIMYAKHTSEKLAIT